MLAIKAVLMKLCQMIAKGFLGFVIGEVLDVHAGVRLIFALGVLGGQYEDWDLRKRTVTEGAVTKYSSG